KSAAISPEGNRVATGTFQYTMELWDFNTAKRTYVAGNPDSKGAPTARGFTLYGTHVVSGSQSDLRLWDVPNDVRVFAGDSARVAVSGDGKHILVAGSGTLRIVDAATGQDIREISGI